MSFLWSGVALAAPDLTTLSLEQLLNVEVTSASKVAQKISETPASVTVIQRQDIRDLGYRTLADVLASVRGFDMTSDRIYNYAGVRGFSPPGDFNARLLVMIDGYRINDAVYDQAFIGTDLPIDLDLVERIEIVRGPGASLYGGNALFGVVNLITRKGTDVGGTEVALARASGRSTALRVSLGHRMDNGGDLLLSVDGEHSRGANLYFTEFGGNTSTTDGMENGRLFIKVGQGGTRLTGAFSRRNKGNPGALSSDTFNDERNRIVDEQGFLDLHHVTTVGAATELTGRLFLGSYDFIGDYVFAADQPAHPSTYISRDTGHARWTGFELQGVTPMGTNHRLVYGIEHQSNTRQQQFNRDVDTNVENLASRMHSHRTGAFLQDDYQMTPTLAFTGGLRLDHVTAQKNEVSPRLAAIWKMQEQTTWKFLYGTAFRAPNAYETSYALGTTQIANPSLKPERITTFETTLEHYLRRDLRLMVAAYTYQIEKQISQVGNPLQYQNMPDVDGQGLEFEVEKIRADGAHLRSSLSVQTAKDYEGRWPVNSPRRQFKASWIKPVLDRWRLGIEGRAVSERRTNLGTTGGYAVANLTLTRPVIQQGLEFSASLYNLFDRRYADPVGEDNLDLNRNTFPTDGRTFRLKITSRF
ncbi:MAG: TonB-dependent receptor [Rhodocyclaceae bacterium]|nr:TonB-dependent receptor [Rhodocyclaceae bacterium]